VPPLLTTWGQVLSGALLVLALAAALERGAPLAVTPRAIAVLLYLAIFGTVLTYLALFWLLPRVPLAAVGAIPLVDTAVAVGLGALVLSEPVGWNFAAGGVLVLGAAAMANLSRR
jgi:drug/metabolite transporter (DMT)-like permease